MRVIGTLAPGGDTEAPTQPLNLQATAINRQRVDLSWSGSTDNIGVTGYQVFRNGAPLDVAPDTTFVDTTASPNTTYTYVVVAFDGAGNNSLPSAQAQATTPANASPTWQTVPTQSLVVGDSYQLNLNNFCSDADADMIQYSILSGTLPSGITRTGAIISGTPTTAGQNPTVTVRAFDGFVNVDTTILFQTFSPDLTAPPVPTGLVATTVSASQINLTWSASTDAAGGANEFVSGTQDYRVYRSTDGSNFSLRTTVTSASYSDTGLSASTTYHYKVAARDVELNESAQSTAAQATTQASQPGVGITTFSILGAQTTTQRFCFMHAFYPGDVPPNTYVSANALSTFQSQIMSRWRDGSAKLVSIAGRKAVTANVASAIILEATAGTQPGSALTEAQLITFNPQVTVAFSGGVSATLTLASLLGQTSTGAHTSNGLVRTHITGPQMSEFHYRSQVGSDASLAVWFYVRFFGDDCEVDIQPENTRLFGTLAQKSYNVTITVNGTSRHSASYSHWARAAWAGCHWYNTGTSGLTDYFRVIPLHDKAYFISTGLVPPCAFPGPINSNTFARFGSGITPLGGASHGSTDFSGGGFQDFIGLLNNFDCAHLIAPTAQTFDAMMRNQLAFKTWPVNTRDETTGSPARPTTYPQGVFPNNSGWSGGTAFAEPSNSTSTFTWNASGGQTNAHLPPAGYFPYLVTGRWHFAEDCAFWALRGYYDNNPASRTTLSQWTMRGGNYQERAKGWMLRSIAMAAVCYPDTPPRTADVNLRADLLTIIGDQFTYWEANGIGTGIGVNKDGYRITPPPSFRWVNFDDAGRHYTSTDLPVDPWMENMRIACVGMIWDFDLPLTDAQRDAFRRVRDDWYAYPVGLTGDGNNFCLRESGATRIVAASTNGSTVTVLSSWRAVWNREVALGNISGSATCNLTDAWGHDTSMQGNHALKLPALAYAVKHHAVGAAEALNRMKSSSTWATFSQCLASSDGSNPMMWYVLPELAPAWFTALPSSQWGQIALTADIDAVDPDLPNLPMPPGSPAAGVLDFTGAWSGAFFDEDWNDYGYNAAGGHANHWGNHGFAINLRRAIPKWRRYIDSTPAGSAGNPEQTGSTYADGRSRAMHCSFVSWGAGRIVYALQNSVTSGGGGTVQGIASFRKERLGYASVPTPYSSTSGYPLSGVNLWGFHGDPHTQSITTTGKFGVSAYDKLSRVLWWVGSDGENSQPYGSINMGATISRRTSGFLPFSNFGMCRANAVACSLDVHLYVVLSSLSNEIGFIDLNNEGLGWAKPTATSGSAPTFASLGSFNIPSQNIAMVYYERARQFLLCDPRRLGSTVYVLTPPRNADGSFNRTGTWAWRTVNSSAVTFTHDGGHESTYTKLQICQEMGDGRGCLIFCGSVNGPTYPYPLPATGQ